VIIAAAAVTGTPWLLVAGLAGHGLKDLWQQTYQPDGWSALGDRTRRAIFERLTEHPSPVGALAETLPVSRPAVSQHLKVLKEAGLVTDEPAGNRRIYRINPDGLDVLRADLDRFWSSTLAAYKAVVEQQEEDT
jgi:DNA-binding transcriptional ArsR family regulator